MSEIVLHAPYREHGVSWTIQGRRFHKTFENPTSRDWFILIVLDPRFVFQVQRWHSFEKGDPLTLQQHELCDAELEHK